MAASVRVALPPLSASEAALRMAGERWQSPSMRAQEWEQPQPDRQTGVCTRWMDDLGFGFVQPDDGSELRFVHHLELRMAPQRPSATCIVHLARQVPQCHFMETYRQGVKSL